MHSIIFGAASMILSKAFDYIYAFYCYENYLSAMGEIEHCNYPISRHNNR